MRMMSSTVCPIHIHIVCRWRPDFSSATVLFPEIMDLHKISQTRSADLGSDPPLFMSSYSKRLNRSYISSPTLRLFVNKCPGLKGFEREEETDHL
jgi:hypothetical protein